MILHATRAESLRRTREVLQSRPFKKHTVRSCWLLLLPDDLSSPANTAGTTYCAIGALKLLQIVTPEDRDQAEALSLPGLSEEACRDLLCWLVHRQTQYINLVDEELGLYEADPVEKPSHDKQSSSSASQPAPFSTSVEDDRRAGPPDIVSLDEDLRSAGFNGRCNKVADTCYSFWVGGSLAVLILPFQTVFVFDQVF